MLHPQRSLALPCYCKQPADLCYLAAGLWQDGVLCTTLLRLLRTSATSISTRVRLPHVALSESWLRSFDASVYVSCNAEVVVKCMKTDSRASTRVVQQTNTTRLSATANLSCEGLQVRLSRGVFACRCASAKEKQCTQAQENKYIAPTTISCKVSQLLMWPERPFSYGFVRKPREF